MAKVNTGHYFMLISAVYLEAIEWNSLPHDHLKDDNLGTVLKYCSLRWKICQVDRMWSLFI